ncbi:MAG: tape measure protein [Gammaproteobacteria bacterium]|nr:tape measure protein [Gammaproteobacteria bacterium]
MTETASLVIKVDSRGAKSATGDLDKLTAAGDRSERAANKLGKAWGVAIGVIGSAVVVGATRSFIQLADASANMAARLRLATTSQEAFNKAHKATFEIAQRTSTELGSVVDLYAKLDQSTRSLGVSQNDLLRLTETITQTFQISGATAQEASGGLRQLSQAMAGGTLRAEEFNSIIESSPRLVQALADGMGIEFGKVRQYVNEGKISSEALVQALLSQSQAIQSEFDKMPLTVGRAMQEVRNALTGLVGGADEASGATSGLASAIEDLAEAITDPDFQNAFNALAEIAVNAASAFVTLAGEISSAYEEAQKWLNLQLGGNRKMGGENIAEQQRELAKIDAEIARRENGFMTGFGALGLLSEEQLRKRRRQVEETIALNEMLFGDPTSPEQQVRWIDPSVAGTMGEDRHLRGPDASPITLGAGKGGKEKRPTEEEKAWLEWEKELLAHEQVADAARREFTNNTLSRLNDEEDARERQKKATQDFIKDLEFEASLIGLSNVEREKAIALRHAGAAATDEERRAISDLIEKIERGREAEAVTMDLKRGLGDIFMAISDGSRSASEAFSRMIDNLKQRAADALADQAINALIAGFSGMGKDGGGFWASFMGYFTGGQKAAGGPLQAGQGYVVGDGGKPELFVPNQSGTLYPLGQAAGGAQPRVTVNVHNAPAGTEVQQSQGADGGLQIDVMVKQMEGGMAGNVAMGASPFNRAFESRYGLRPVV